MSRLTSIEKGGYYEFPPAHLPALASLFAPTQHSDSKFIDPCAGEGRALDFLAKSLNLIPYANELEDQRAEACKALFGPTQTVHGDMYQLKASNQAFVGAWVNPPYTWDMTGTDKRRELAMLKHSLKWVQPDGLLAWCVYGQHVTLEATGFLARHSSQIDVWQLPGLHLGEYTHVVVIARLGQPSDDPARLALNLVQAGQAGAWPELTVQGTPCYEFPMPAHKKSFLFTPRIIAPELALQFVQQAGVQFNQAIQQLVAVEQPPEKIRPVVRPRGGQLALILAAGLFNGLVLPTEKGRMAVRSTVESVEVQTEGGTADDVDESDTSTVEREVYRTQSVVTITLLGDDGSCDDISGDGPIAGFIKTHKPTLLAYLDEHFTPLYSFDYTPLKRVLARSKGGKLYATQKHVIAACHTALQQRKSAILVGEPGSGKSIMGATVAVALQPQMKPGQVTLIMCPPHLVEKWEREVKAATANAFVNILRNVDDVVSFMDKAAQFGANRLNVGILSRETAKLGEGWAVAVNWRKHRQVRWPHSAARPVDETGQEMTGERIITLQEPICPACGTVVAEATDLSHKAKRDHKYSRGNKKPATGTPVTPAWLERVPRFCHHCGSALWSRTRTFSKPKAGNRPARNPRTPLAEFIAQRYADRLYLFVADELHECKNASTDQGEAMSVLANAATKTLGLTGTLYGGTASTLYAIEYIFNPRVRAKYPWGRGVNKWVRDMGSLERIVEYKPQYDKAGVYSGKRRMEQKPKEAPGCSPLLVSEIIDHCIFVGLADMGKKMPDFEEVPVPITPDPEVAAHYFEAKQTLGQYLFKCRLEGDASALGMYLQTLLSWPSAPYRTEPCIHRKRLTRDSDVFVEIPVHTIEALPEDRLYAKEGWLIDTVREELAQDRGVAVFVRQTGTRDIQGRVAKLLTDHLPDAKPYILKGSVKADKRESLLDAQVAAGTNLLICNPRLVQTGLDLLAFPTIIFFETDYSLYVTGQASRRAWRLIQDRPCKVYYPFYEGLMENQAVELIGRKQQAAALLYGENGGSGLSALNGDDGGNLLAALAAEIGQDSTVTDLSALFAKHAHEVDPAESAWFAAETDEAEVSVEPEVALDVPEPAAVEVAQPSPMGSARRVPAKVDATPSVLALLSQLAPRAAAQSASAAPVPSVPALVPKPATTPAAPNTLAPLPPLRIVKRRRKLDLSAAPVDAPLPLLSVLTRQAVPSVREAAPRPLSLPPLPIPAGPAVQLALL